jgi:hypothetical protein
MCIYPPQDSWFKRHTLAPKNLSKREYIPEFPQQTCMLVTMHGKHMRLLMKICMCTHTCVHACVLEYSQGLYRTRGSKYTRVHACIHTYMQMYICTYVHMYVCVYIYIYEEVYRNIPNGPVSPPPHMGFSQKRPCRAHSSEVSHMHTYLIFMSAKIRGFPRRVCAMRSSSCILYQDHLT